MNAESPSAAAPRPLVTDGLAVRRNHGLPLSRVLLAANTPMLIKAALVDGRPDAGVLPAGQVVGMIDDLPSCEELIDRVVTDAARTLSGTGNPVYAACSNEFSLYALRARQASTGSRSR